MLKVRRCSHHGGHLYLGQWHVLAWVWDPGCGWSVSQYRGCWAIRLGRVILTNSEG